MKILIWICEKCGQEIEVESVETSQYRGIACENCAGTFAVLNSELKAKPVAAKIGDE